MCDRRRTCEVSGNFAGLGANAVRALFEARLSLCRQPGPLVGLGLGGRCGRHTGGRLTIAGKAGVRPIERLFSLCRKETDRDRLVAALLKSEDLDLVEGGRLQESIGDGKRCEIGRYVHVVLRHGK